MDIYIFYLLGKHFVLYVKSECLNVKHNRRINVQMVTATFYFLFWTDSRPNYWWHWPFETHAKTTKKSPNLVTGGVSFPSELKKKGKKKLTS